MKPINFLDKELAKEIYNFSIETVYTNPIDALHFLKHIFDTTGGIAYFEEETAKKIHYIIENHPEQLLLHFATYNPRNEAYVEFSTPITDEVSIITTIQKYNDGGPTANATALVHKDSDIQFDLTLVDTYQGKDDAPINYVSTYVYGEPGNEDWTHKKVTKFTDIKTAISNNK